MEKQLEFHNRTSNGEPGLVVVRWREQLAGWRTSASLDDLLGTELGTDFLMRYRITKLTAHTTPSGVRRGELKLENHFLDTSGSTISKTTEPFVSSKLVLLDFSKPGLKHMPMDIELDRPWDWEVGPFPKLKEIMEQCKLPEGLKTGVLRVYGTGGDMEGNKNEFMKLFMQNEEIVKHSWIDPIAWQAHTEKMNRFLPPFFGGPIPVAKHRRGGMPEKTMYYAALDPYNTESMEQQQAPAGYIKAKARRKGFSAAPFLAETRREAERREQSWKEFKQQAEENCWSMAIALEYKEVERFAEHEQKDFEDVIDELRGYYATIYDHEI